MSEQLKLQVKILADRLALAVAEFQTLEIDCGLERDVESAEHFRHLQEVLLGKHADSFEIMRYAKRREGQYQVALNRIRESLRAQVRESHAEVSKPADRDRRRAVREPKGSEPVRGVETA